jgi:hypothetical protein
LSDLRSGFFGFPRAERNNDMIFATIRANMGVQRRWQPWEHLWRRTGRGKKKKAQKAKKGDANDHERGSQGARRQKMGRAWADSISVHTSSHDKGPATAKVHRSAGKGNFRVRWIALAR